MREDWRMAFMFDARDGQFERMEKDLTLAADEIRRLAGDAKVRLGVAARYPETEYSATGVRSVDGAVEVSIATSGKSQLPAIVIALSKVLDGVIEPSSLEVMAGPYYPMVPVRDGDTFLSLAFRRYPTKTSEQFRRWWHDQHAPTAIPILGPGLLAYDQVHVEASTTQQLANVLEIAAVSYDAYDNLTWPSLTAYLASISEPVGMERLYQDETGWIDNSSRRAALMRRVGK